MVSKFNIPPIYHIGGIFMFITKEKRIIYRLMKERIEERKELSKQYFDLKLQLEKLDKSDKTLTKINKNNLSILETEKIAEQDHLRKKNKIGHTILFDRVSKSIISIMKQSSISLSNKQIMTKLNTEYELSVSLKNLSCNILPKMTKDRTLPIEPVCRKYWRYHLSRV